MHDHHCQEQKSYFLAITIRNLKIGGADCLVKIQAATPHAAIKLDHLPADWTYSVEQEGCWQK